MIEGSGGMKERGRCDLVMAYKIINKMSVFAMLSTSL